MTSDDRIIYSHFDIPVPGSDKPGGATIAVDVGEGVAIVGVALRSPHDQLWRDKGRHIARGRLELGAGRTFTFGVAGDATRHQIVTEARRLVMSMVRWQNYPFSRWIEGY